MCANASEEQAGQHGCHSKGLTTGSTIHRRWKRQIMHAKSGRARHAIPVRDHRAPPQRQRMRPCPCGSRCASDLLLPSALLPCSPLPCKHAAIRILRFLGRKVSCQRIHRWHVAATPGFNSLQQRQRRLHIHVDPGACQVCIQSQLGRMQYPALL